MGKAAARRQPEWEKTVAAVRKRAKGRCDCCGLPCEPELLDPHHCFGRNNQIPRKYADMPELIAALRRECHNQVTDHPRCYAAGVLRTRAAKRLVEAYGTMPYWQYGPAYTPLQIVRDVIRTLEQQEAA